MLLATFKTEIEQGTQVKGISDLIAEDYRLAIFDHEEFSYEITGIEVDKETQRIIIRVRDSILVPISKGRKDGQQ